MPISVAVSRLPRAPIKWRQGTVAGFLQAAGEHTFGGNSMLAQSALTLLRWQSSCAGAYLVLICESAYQASPNVFRQRTVHGSVPLTSLCFPGAGLSKREVVAKKQVIVACMQH